MRKFTIEEVKAGLTCCIQEDCMVCPFKDLPMIECELSLLNLAKNTIDYYEEQLKNGVDNQTLISNKKKRRRRK